MNAGRTFYELIADTFKLFFGPLFLKALVIAALFYVPYVALNAAVNPSPASSLQSFGKMADWAENYRTGQQTLTEEILSGPGTENKTPPPAPLQALTAVAGILAGLLHSAGVIFLTGKYRAQNTVPSTGEILAKIFELFPWILGTALLVFLALVGWTLLFIIPGLIFSVYYLFSMQAVMLRGKHGWEAVKYSKALVKGRWWSVFLTGVGLTLLFAVMQLSAQVIFITLEALIRMAGVHAVLSELAMKILGGFTLTGMTLLFLQLEQEKKTV